MHWILSAPFITERTQGWLEPFVAPGHHTFRTIPADYRHDRSRPSTSLAQWRDYLRHGSASWRASQEGSGPSGLITVFPQLSLTIGMHKRLARQSRPLLAWCFNLGQVYGGGRQALARFALRAVDHFVVHSRREIEVYSNWLALPRERFSFVPLQRPLEPIEVDEDTEHPFVLAMGSARRDYRLFLEVMAELGTRTVVVASEHALAGLRIPANVTVHHRLSGQECRVLAQRARINVVPGDTPSTAPGQVTLIESMMYGRATIATRSVGTTDYAEDGVSALLVPAGDGRALQTAIRALWNDRARRSALGMAARHYVEQHLSDAAAGRALGALLDALERAHRARAAGRGGIEPHARPTRRNE